MRLCQIFLSPGKGPSPEATETFHFQFDRTGAAESSFELQSLSGRRPTARDSDSGLARGPSLPLQTSPRHIRDSWLTAGECRVNVALRLFKSRSAYAERQAQARRLVPRPHYDSHTGGGELKGVCRITVTRMQVKDVLERRRPA
jgi:hypothetical protein